MKLRPDDIITVCDSCLRACCWQGKFMCDDAQHSGEVDKTVKWLKENQKIKEHKCFWEAHYLYT